MEGSFRTISISDPRHESDGLRALTVKSPNLKGRGDIFLFVPQAKSHLADLPVYILLHGVYGSSWSWTLKGGVHRTAREMMERGAIQPALIAMPSDGLWGDGSAYRAHHERDFARWIVHDVPLAIREYLPQAGARSPLCIGGLSMGGYGALTLGAGNPGCFRAISAHSAITRLQELEQFVEEPLEGYRPEASTPDVIDIIRDNRSKLPPLRFDCGLADPLLEGNRMLHQQLQDSGIPHEYAEFEGGHEWDYWGEHVRKTLLFFNAQV